MRPKIKEYSLRRKSPTTTEDFFFGSTNNVVRKTCLSEYELGDVTKDGTAQVRCAPGDSPEQKTEDANFRALSACTKIGNFVSFSV
jgi:hypothetical protein